MAETPMQKIRDWAEERKLPYEMFRKALIDAGWDESRDSISEEEKKAYKKALIRAQVAAKKLSSRPTVPRVAADAPPEEVRDEAPAEAVDSSPEITQLARAKAVAEERERRQREEEAEKARIEADQRALETARKLELEQKDLAATQPKSPPQQHKPATTGARRRAPTRTRGRRRRVGKRPAEELTGERLPIAASGELNGDEMVAQIQPRDIEIPEVIQVADLAHRMSVKANRVLKVLMELGVVATATQVIDQDTAVLVVDEIGHKPVPVQDRAVEDKLEAWLVSDEPPAAKPPVVSVMGHVDHGKTSLLDRIRKTRVTAEEAGGITQHIGAWQVTTDRGAVTFIDTPGHAAFTALRARGARATDLVVLVVAADDGVMPQTEEALTHAREAEVPVVVAINKIDKARANPDRVRQQLAAAGVQVEGFGGEVQAVELSAETGEGIDKLLEAILLEAEMRELKSPVAGAAQGLVLEATVKAGRGSAATLLVQSGCLRVGDFVLVGDQEVKVRAMVSPDGTQVREAGPSAPVEIFGFSSVPAAGQKFAAIDDARLRREVQEYRRRLEDSRKALKDKIGLEALFVDADAQKDFCIVVKADVRGSLEAIQDSLGRLGDERVQARVVAGGIGSIGESDINLAQAVGGLVVGFNVRADALARKAARDLGVEIRYYSTIYELIEDMEKALVGLMEPETREEIIGTAEVREVFTSSSFGQIAGSIVEEGRVHRAKPVRVLRDNVVIFEGELSSLRRFKEDVEEVREGTECGIGIRNYKDVRVGDRIEVFSVRTVQPTLKKSA